MTVMLETNALRVPTIFFRHGTIARLACMLATRMEVQCMRWLMVMMPLLKVSTRTISLIQHSPQHSVSLNLTTTDVIRLLSVTVFYCWK